jgi:hypothetical protein
MPRILYKILPKKQSFTHSNVIFLTALDSIIWEAYIFI